MAAKVTKVSEQLFAIQRYIRQGEIYKGLHALGRGGLNFKKATL